MQSMYHKSSWKKIQNGKIQPAFLPVITYLGSDRKAVFMTRTVERVFTP